MLRFSPFLAVVAVLALGCGPAEEPAEPATGTAATATTATDATLDPATVKLAVEEPIAVSITDGAVAVQGELIPGATQFQVTNDGSQVYSLVIEGPGSRASLEAPLRPLETRSLTVDVQPGSYRFYVPEAQDRLTTTVEVAPVP